jgi:hypothetical protein
MTIRADTPPDGREKRSRWSRFSDYVRKGFHVLNKNERLERVILLAFIAFMVYGSFTLTKVQDEAKQQRKDLTVLTCDINNVLVTFIEAPPDLPRDAPALRRLRAERCKVLLKQVGADRRVMRVGERAP